MKLVTVFKNIQFSKLIKSRRFFILFTVVAYIFFTVFYLGPTTWRCNDTLTGIGDNTGGPIWRASIKPDQPLLGGSEKVTNYPYGESLYTPVSYASIAQASLIRGASKVVGPVCAYNLMNITSYIITSLVMFGFILYLLNNKWIAFLAGYATAFTPYVQSKIGGHPSYGFAALLIGILWLAIHIIRKQRYIHGAALALVLAFCSYFDPYFILLAVTVLLPTLFMWITHSLFSLRKNPDTKKEFLAALKVFIAAFLAFLVLVAPLGIIRVRDAKFIGATTGVTRGNIELAAMKCSNLPLDYILPDPYNPNFTKIFGARYTAKNISLRNWCGSGESRVSISLVVLSVVSLGVIVALWERLNKRRLHLSQLLGDKSVIIIGSVLLVAVAAFALGLPPRIGGILTPSGIVVKITETWRIFAREYLVLNMALIILFSIILSYIRLTFGARFRKIIPLVFVGTFLAIMFEYQIYSPFDPFTFSFKRDVPKTYQRIGKDPDISAIAEYPIDRMGIESDVIVYYTTMQIVHKKPILNSAIPSGSQDKLHVAIKDLTDPQTIPILRYLGVKYITIHSLSASEVMSKTDQLEIISEETPPVYGLTILKAAPSNTIVLAKIKDGPKLDHPLTIQKGFAVNTTIMKSPVDMEYESLSGTELTVGSLGTTDKNTLVPVCFDVKMSAPIDSAILEVTVNGVSRYTAPVNGTYQSVKIEARVGETITVKNSKGFNQRINNLGCR